MIRRPDPFMSFDPFADFEPREERTYHDADEYRCDGGCGRMVENLGQWCDTCTVANAQACGDWDEEAIEAAERIGVKH
jgi:hypothetical protein